MQRCRGLLVGEIAEKQNGKQFYSRAYFLKRGNGSTCILSPYAIAITMAAGTAYELINQSTLKDNWGRDGSLAIMRLWRLPLIPRKAHS